MSCINLKKGGKRQQSGGETWWFPDGEKSMNAKVEGFCNHPSARPGGTMVDTGKTQAGYSIYECPFCYNRVFGGPAELNPCADGNSPDDVESVDTKAEFDKYQAIARQYRKKIVLPYTHNELEDKFYPNRYKNQGGKKKSKKAKKSKKFRKSKKKMRKSKNKKR